MGQKRGKPLRDILLGRQVSSLNFHRRSYLPHNLSYHHFLRVNDISIFIKIISNQSFFLFTKHWGYNMQWTDQKVYKHIEKHNGPEIVILVKQFLETLKEDELFKFGKGDTFPSIKLFNKNLSEDHQIIGIEFHARFPVSDLRRRRRGPRTVQG